MPIQSPNVLTNPHEPARNRRNLTPKRPHRNDVDALVKRPNNDLILILGAGVARRHRPQRAGRILIVSATKSTAAPRATAPSPVVASSSRTSPNRQHDPRRQWLTTPNSSNSRLPTPFASPLSATSYHRPFRLSAPASQGFQMTSGCEIMRRSPSNIERRTSLETIT